MRVTDLIPAPVASDEAVASALVTAAQQGDAEAFGELCLRHEARLFRQALGLCGVDVTAAELTQDTLVTAWQSIQRFNGQCRFFTWLCAIMIHLHRRRLRTRRSWKRWFVQDDDLDSAELPSHVVDPAARPDQTLAARERATHFRDCLNALPPKHREVIFLRFYVDESLEGMARALDCSVGTVKSRLFHALEKLRTLRSLQEHNRTHGTES